MPASTRSAEHAENTEPLSREEPDVGSEESVPTDGRDTEGEKLMKEVKNPKLHEPGLAEHKTPEKAEKAEKAEDDKKDA
ncbi:hypothetical protein [Variovorax sp. UC122_21]|uniref:hypothetical protein n=1 Tax=Variovorax sp. UC122_21 TaxID=3374554 RepID=UPI0037570CFB